MAACDDSLRVAVHGHVREHYKLVVLGQRILTKNVRLQVTEAAAESDLLVRRQGLVAEDEEAVGVEGVAHPREIGIVDRPGQIQEIGRAHAELQSLMRISYDVFCLKKKKKKNTTHMHHTRSILDTDLSQIKPNVHQITL